MSRFKNLHEGSASDPRWHMHQQQLRQEMGDEAYEKMVSEFDDRPFKIFGVVFVLVFAVIAFGAAWLGY